MSIFYEFKIVPHNSSLWGTTGVAKFKIHTTKHPTKHHQQHKKNSMQETRVEQDKKTTTNPIENWWFDIHAGT